MSKIVIGAAAAAVWLALSYAAHAATDCRKVCENGTCVSKCIEHHDSGRMEPRHEDHGPDVDVHVPGAGVEVGR